MYFVKQHARWILFGLLAFYGILSIMVSAQESATFDEKAHIPSAYSYVRYGDMRLNPEHPPLLKDLAGLPLLFLNVTFPTNTSEWQTGINEQWALGDLFMNCTHSDIACNDSDAILLWSRFPITLIALLLGLFLFLWGRELGGTLTGLLATAFFVFDPNTIGHGHYVTTDIGIAAFLFFAFYFFTHFLKRPTWRNVFLAGLFLGLAELAKFSAVLLFPVFGLFALIYALTKKSEPKSDQKNSRSRILFEYIGKYAVIVGICFALIALVYALNTWNMPPEKTIANANLVFAGDKAAKTFARETIATLATTPGLAPMAHYFLGVFMVFSRVAGGNTFYFLGTVSDTASPYYFPVIFALKETLPFLFVLIATLGYTLFQMYQALRDKPASAFFTVFSESFQERITQYLSVFFILFYAYISITGNLNIGFRHLFPILPFLYLLVAKTLSDFLRRNLKESGNLLRPLVAILLASMFLIPISIYPSYLSYYNAVAGGHRNGYQIATDSNYDWGQDLKHLRDFIDTHNHCTETGGPNCPDSLSVLPRIDTIRLDYFGGSNPDLFLNGHYTAWHSDNTPEAGWYAVSAVFFQESIYKKKAPGKRGYEWLRDIGETARAGDSIFIFYVKPDNLQ